MFCNHPLPNIAPSLLCLLPPPTHVPPPLPSPPPLTIARTGHARARSSPTAVCAPPLVEGCGQTTRHVTAQVPPPSRLLPTATRVRHVTARARHVTAQVSPPSRSLPTATRVRHVTAATRHVTAHKRRVRHVTDDDDRNRRVGVRRSEEDGTQSQDAGGGGTRM